MRLRHVPNALALRSSRAFSLRLDVRPPPSRSFPPPPAFLLLSASNAWGGNSLSPSYAFPSSASLYGYTGVTLTHTLQMRKVKSGFKQLARSPRQVQALPPAPRQPHVIRLHTQFTRSLPAALKSFCFCPAKDAPSHLCSN